MIYVILFIRAHDDCTVVAIYSVVSIPEGFHTTLCGCSIFISLILHIVAIASESSDHRAVREINRLMQISNALREYGFDELRFYHESIRSSCDRRGGHTQRLRNFTALFYGNRAASRGQRGLPRITGFYSLIHYKTPSERKTGP